MHFRYIFFNITIDISAIIFPLKQQYNRPKVSKY